MIMDFTPPLIIRNGISRFITMGCKSDTLHSLHVSSVNDNVVVTKQLSVFSHRMADGTH